jgi:hypothetical protein
MKRLSLLTLVFAVLSTVFFLLLIFFRSPFPPYRLLNWQDIFDLLTPLVLIPLYWLMFKYASSTASTTREEITFIVLSSLWAMGHGMHLAANALDNLIESLVKLQVMDVKGTDIYALSYFMDEHLSHYLWHTAVIGLALLLIYREWRHPAGEKTTWWATGLAGFIYGFTLFCLFLEGQTVPLGLPSMAVITLVTLFWGRKKLSQQPILAFFFVASFVALLFLIGWGLYWGGFPQFSDVGLI